MPKISIIIAMYNIEKYIAYCIKSCINQEGVNPEDYEIIIVNDGSTDNSLLIAQKTIENVTNARIVGRPNGGLSAARNTGIENARGEYLWFVDGDDAITANSIKTLLSNIRGTNHDAYIINFSTFETKDIIDTSNFKGYAKPISGKDYHFKYNTILPMMAWLTIFKTSMLNNNKLVFLQGINHEDLEFSIRAHHKSSSISFIKENLYLYRIARKDSIMENLNKDNTKSLMSFIQIINSFKTFFEDIDNSFVRRLYGSCATLFFLNRYNDGFISNETTTNLLKNNKKSLYRYLWRSRRWKQRVLLLSILLLPQTVVRRIINRFNGHTKFM